MQEEIGFPYTVLPEEMFHHAGGGYGGQGTLCGSIGACAAIINLVAYDGQKTHSKLVANLIHWYERQKFPAAIFDDYAVSKQQIQEVPGSPLCHASVSTWMLAAGASYKEKQRKDRCAKVAGGTAYRTVEMLNAHAAGKYAFGGAERTADTENCLSCHGHEGEYNEKGLNNCLTCHDDHTK